MCHYAECHYAECRGALGSDKINKTRKLFYFDFIQIWETAIKLFFLRPPPPPPPPPSDKFLRIELGILKGEVSLYH